MDIEKRSKAKTTSTTLSIVMKHCRQAKTAGVVLNPQSFILDCGVSAVRPEAASLDGCGGSVTAVVTHYTTHTTHPPT